MNLLVSLIHNPLIKLNSWWLSIKCLTGYKDIGIGIDLWIIVVVNFKISISEFKVIVSPKEPF